MPQDGVPRADVDKLRREIESAIGDAVRRLRAIETLAQQRHRDITTERQHLESFLDDLQYRLRSAASSGELPTTITGPLSESQLSAMQGQQETLGQRKGELAETGDELEQLNNRLNWLVHQIEGASDWVLSDPEAETDGSQAREDQPNAGKQVMWAQIAMGQEAERARLAREIHDGPAQALANTVMRLQFVEQMLKHRPEDVESELSKLRTALQESLKDVRRFIFNLRPASLTDAGLLPTLRYYTQDYSEQFDMPIELNLPEALTLSANQELVVFRVVQEALQNIHKHAEATRVDVNVQQRPSGPLVVTVSDDGKGFDARLARQGRTGSSGLVSMRERAATVGGTLKVDTRHGTGTTITLILPIPKTE